MDFLSDTGRRRVNLSGRSVDPTATQSRADTLEQARLQRLARQKEKEREQAAGKIQSFWRSRHSHGRVVASHRQRFDAELLQLAQGAQSGVPIAAHTLSKFVALYFSFSRLARTRPRVLPRPTNASRALEAQDRQRFRHLVKLLLAGYRGAKTGHLGSLILTKTVTTEWPRTPAPNASGLTPDARQWVYQTRRIASLLLEHIGLTKAHAMEQVGLEVQLLWLILDSNQWPFVKDTSQSSVEDRALIQRAQQLLLHQLVVPAGQSSLETVAHVTASTSAASSSSSSSSARPVAPRPIRPVLDIFHCIRTRILDLTLITSDSVASPEQLAQKMPVTLLFATIIRCMNLVSDSAVSGSPENNPVVLSFVYHVLSMPALAQRLKFLNLQQLTPLFLAPALWDRSLEALTFHLRLKNFSIPSPLPANHPFSIGNINSPVRVMSNPSFASVSYTWFDSTPAAQKSLNHDSSDAMEVDFSAAALPSTPTSSTAAASSSSGSSSVPAPSSSPSPTYTYFATPKSTAPRLISGLAWIFGNLLELVGGLDETKSEAASRSFSAFLGAIDVLIQELPTRELPTLTTEGTDFMHSQLNQFFPPVFVRQFSVFGQRAFLDRLCRRLMSGESEQVTVKQTTDQDVEMKASDEPAGSPSATSNNTSLTALNDIPVICVLIDSILYRWSASSNSILNTLVFSSNIVQRLWTSIRRSGLLDRIEAAGKGTGLNLTPFPSTPTHTAAAASSSSSSTAMILSSPHPTSSTVSASSIGDVFHDRFFNLLPLFCTMYGHLLLILDDAEFFEKQQPFSLAQDVVPMVSMLKTLLFQLYWNGFSGSGTPARLRERFSKLFIQLRDRQTRKQFMPPELWLFNTPMMTVPLETIQNELAQEEEMREELPPETQAHLPATRASSLITSIPFVLPFGDRVKILMQFIHSDKQRQRESGVLFDHGLGRRIKIRRKAVLEDAFESLAGLSGSDMKGRIQVEFTDEHGIPEPGLDGGGLWKELITEFLRKAFDPSYNLFSSTPQHFLYPNPQALDLPIIPQEDGAMLDDASPDHTQLTLSYFYFVGQMIGKALYDGIQIDSQFALFFLRSLVGHLNYLDDLQGLDPVIYSSLMKLKSYGEKPGENIEDLGLTFSVDRQVFGTTKSYDLIPNGKDITVTNENKVRFIYLMSDYYLNKQMSKQMSHFQQGILSILHPSWLRMFAAEELRLLISGSQSVNRKDFQQHTQYSSGYTKDHELIKMFWQVVMEEFTDEQVALLLKFATSCSRAPLMGFQYLYPQFCIQRVNIDANEQALPTAATCANLLRLPRYSTKQRLKEKLLYAITTASSGFGLT